MSGDIHRERDEERRGIDTDRKHTHTHTRTHTHTHTHKHTRTHTHAHTQRTHTKRIELNFSTLAIMQIVQFWVDRYKNYIFVNRN